MQVNSRACAEQQGRSATRKAEQQGTRSSKAGGVTSRLSSRKSVAAGQVEQQGRRSSRAGGAAGQA